MESYCYRVKKKIQRSTLLKILGTAFNHL
jgi:hypothetical protein